MDNNTKIIEAKLANAMSNITPDVLENILSNCREPEGVVIKMKKNINIKLRLLICAAAFILVAGCGLGVNAYQSNFTIDSVIGLDVNPSIELKINKSEKVMELDALNEDGKKIIGDMELKGSKLDVTVNALIGSMLQQGYISDIQNSILVSVQNKNSPKCVALESKLTQEIKDILKSNAIDGAVMTQATQDIQGNAELANLAKTNDISVGKAKLIDNITKQNPAYVFEDLSKMSINDLKLLSDSKKITLKDVNTVGEASEKSYIGKDKAKEIAFTHSNVKVSDAKKISVDLDSEKGIIVYDVEFDVAGFEYEYDINATTGDIIKNKKVAIKDEDKTNNKDDDKDDAISTPTTGKDNDKDDDKDDDDDDKVLSGNTNTNQDKNINDAISTPTADKDQANNKYIGTEQAKSIALTHSGVVAEQAKHFNVEVEGKGNKAYYDVEFTSEDIEYNYKINANDGSIIKSYKVTANAKDTENQKDKDDDDDDKKDKDKDKDDDDDKDEKQHKDNSNNTIGINDAKNNNDSKDNNDTKDVVTDKNVVNNKDTANNVANNGNKDESDDTDNDDE